MMIASAAITTNASGRESPFLHCGPAIKLASGARLRPESCTLTRAGFVGKFDMENIMSLGSLDELFLHQLKDTYDAEKQLTKALPKMKKGANSEELAAAFDEHLAVTKQHIERLERVFEIIGKPARGKKCAGMEGLVKEGAEVLEEEGTEATLDAALIAAAQKVEHYEIAAYGTMVAHAEILGLKEAAKLLKQTLAEEKQADETLSKVASSINFEADKEDAED
jgi:ferritin-like metal-binding protein YciE